LVRGCEFRKALKHIAMISRVERAVITGNLFTGPAHIENAAGLRAQIGLNASGTATQA
jgi:hypothetical protein